MLRGVLLLLVTLAALPLANADVAFSGAVASDAQSAPQIHCELVQTSPRPSADPLACNQSGAANKITVLRMRGSGVGSAYAVLHDNVRNVQLATLDCASLGKAECRQDFSLFGVTASQVSLYGRAYGPGGAAWVITVERVPHNAAVPT